VRQNDDIKQVRTYSRRTPGCAFYLFELRIAHRLEFIVNKSAYVQSDRKHPLPFCGNEKTGVSPRDATIVESRSSARERERERERERKTEEKIKNITRILPIDQHFLRRK